MVQTQSPTSGCMASQRLNGCSHLHDDLKCFQDLPFGLTIRPGESRILAFVVRLGKGCKLNAAGTKLAARAPDSQTLVLQTSTGSAA